MDVVVETVTVLETAGAPLDRSEFENIKISKTDILPMSDVYKL